MEKEDIEKKKEDREKVLIPVRQEKTIHEEEIVEEPAEKMWKIPRRWHVY